MTIANTIRERDFYMIWLAALKQSPDGLGNGMLLQYSLNFASEYGIMSDDQINNKQQKEIIMNISSHRKTGIFQDFPMITDVKIEGTRKLQYHITEFGMDFFDQDLIDLAKTDWKAYQVAIDVAFGKYKAVKGGIKAGKNTKDSDDVVAVGVDSAAFYNEAVTKEEAVILLSGLNVETLKELKLSIWAKMDADTEIEADYNLMYAINRYGNKLVK